MLTQENNVLIEKHVRHFLLYDHLQIFWYGNTLTNKYCKTGVLEHTLLRTRFVWSVCMCHIWQEQFYWCCMYAKWDYTPGLILASEISLAIAVAVKP